MSNKFFKKEESDMSTDKNVGEPQEHLIFGDILAILNIYKAGRRRDKLKNLFTNKFTAVDKQLSRNLDKNLEKKNTLAAHGNLLALMKPMENEPNQKKTKLAAHFNGAAMAVLIPLTISALYDTKSGFALGASAICAYAFGYLLYPKYENHIS